MTFNPRIWRLLPKKSATPWSCWFLMAIGRVAAPWSFWWPKPLRTVISTPKPPSAWVRTALAKSKPGQLNFSSGGEGTSSFLTGELFKKMAGISIVHVPYKGAGPALIDTIAGQIEINFASVFSALPHVKSGALRALGVSSAKRSVVLPDLSTIAEAGVKGYSRTTWYGVLAPSRTPAAIVNKLNWEFEKTLQSADVRQRLLTDGSEPAGGTPKRFQDFLANEFEVTQKIIRRAGVSK